MLKNRPYLITLGFLWLLALTFNLINIIIQTKEHGLVTLNDLFQFTKEAPLAYSPLILAILVNCLPFFVWIIQKLTPSAPKLSPTQKNKIKIQYQKATKKINQKQIDLQKSAILNLDTLVDHTLKYLGYQGSLGQKLKNNPHLFSDINGLWKAHKLRNKIAHELDWQPTSQEIKSAHQQFAKALQDLGGL